MLFSDLRNSCSIVFCVFLLSSCANYKLNYLPEVENWQEKTPPDSLALRHSLYLIGNLGTDDEQKDFFGYLEKTLQNAPEESTIVFLGDNIYPTGMPPKSEKENRERAEEQLDKQLELLSNFKGKVLYIPGHNDWTRYGLEGLDRQEKYIQKRLAKTHDLDEDEEKSTFLPNDGCSGPEVVEINEQLVIIAIDSEWWLEDWDKHPEINSDCDIRNRENFLYYFEEALRKYRTRNVVVVMHHPIYSNGPHGGYLTPKDHLFPLTSYFKKGYLPIPIIGSVGSVLRKRGILRQDLGHPLYKDLRTGVVDAASKNGSYIFAAGHEHNLQYWEKEQQVFIVSGAGSDEKAVKARDGGLFAYAKKGLARLDFYEDGSAWVHFLAPDEKGEKDDLVFRHQVKGQLEILEEFEEMEVHAFDEKVEEVSVTPTTSDIREASLFAQPLSGDHYRDVYLQKYQFPTLNLEDFVGGVEPVKMGGGRQTNSLRLEAKNGKQYAMRALTKDASRLLPYPLNEVSFAQYIAQDIFLATHPFGAIVVPPLADAAQVYHTNPKLYYIPKQPALKKYNAFFGDEVYLVEERPDEDWRDEASLGHSEDIISTPKLLERLGNNKRHKVDQDWVVRARLFDLVIGDWDRHDDQWRWASFEGEEEDGIKTYRPIPRDRDQVFPNYDGLLVGIARFSQPILKQLTPYGEDIKNIKWSVYNARYFDTSFMNEMEWEDWQQEVRFLQKELTDEVIDAAFATANATQDKDLQFKDIAEVMKKRRDNLMDFARRFYLLNAKKVDVVGTNDKELFIIDRQTDSTTLVRMYDPKQDTVAYERLFNNKETKEIHIYGLEDDDKFLVKGEVNMGIKLRIIGGLGEDSVFDQSKVESFGKKTLYYDFDTEENIVISEFGELKDLQSSVTERNMYDRKHPHTEFNFTRPLPILGFNPDEGLSIGLNLLRKVYQFKKSPYSQLHSLNVAYISALNSTDVIYQGEFLRAIKEWDLIAYLRAHGDRFAFNYFGLGNESLNPVDDLDFNRTRQSQLLFKLAARKRFLSDIGRLSVGAFIEETELQRTPDRFISTLELPEELFEERFYAGAEVQLNIDRIDNELSPKRGAKFHFSYTYQYNLSNDDLSFGQLNTNLSLYFPLDSKMRYIFASRVGSTINYNDTDFFKRPTLGGNTNLRGFRAERFRGDATFYHNTDLRAKVLESVNRFLPFTLGLHAGFDHGRVWLENEDSDTWHYSYGGGIWIAPADLLMLSAGFYRSREQGRVLVQLGHLF